LLFTFWFLACDVLLPLVVAQSGITQTTTILSEARWGLAATFSSGLVFFAGGFNATGPSDRVDICNATNGSWTTASLSVPRGALAATSSGNLVFFGGGWNWTNPFAQVDIYIITDGSWNTATLSQARCCVAATSVGNLVLFGGGFNYSIGDSNTVDIYNETSNTWTTATLSQARSNLAATSVANRYALFAGGWNAAGGSNAVDIFDSLSGSWNSATLSQARRGLAAVSLGNLAFFGGGGICCPFLTSNVVDIFNATTQTWSTATLSQNRTWLAAASNGDIVAFGGGDNISNFLAVVDMYNATSNIWFTATLSEPRAGLAATSSINTIYFGGGQSNGVPSNIVDIFDFPSPPTPSNAGMVPTSVVSPPPSNSALIGGLIGGLIVVLVIGAGTFLVIILVLRRRKRKHNQIINSYNATNLSKTTTREASQTELASQIQLPETSRTFTKYSQISLKEITIEKELGEGKYGKVCLGKWHAACVALKFCKNKAKIDEFMNEMILMIELPPHPNVVHLFGVSLDGPQPVIVMEYCAGGSLDTVLFDINVKLSDEQKIRFVRGIALGMLHLHEHNIVHRDLAARNILLTGSGDPKISDFGMSRIVETTGEGKTKSDIGPVRWMAPESLAKRIYSKKSDVWTFGIVVYEIVARREPHKEVNPLEVGRLIRDRHLTPKIPSHCPQILREVMQLCWQADPNQRPSFKEICRLLEL